MDEFVQAFVSILSLLQGNTINFVKYDCPIFSSGHSTGFGFVKRVKVSRTSA